MLKTILIRIPLVLIFSFVLFFLVAGCSEDDGSGAPEIKPEITKPEALPPSLPPLAARTPLIPQSPCSAPGALPDVPRDFEVKGTMELSKCASFNRLILTKDSKIVTTGQDLEIRAVELVSEDAFIESFAKDVRASSGRDGRNGGRLWVRAARVSGQLTIYARGESGGHGESGYPGKSGAPGIPGNDGRWEVNPEAARHFLDSARIRDEMLGKVQPGFYRRSWDEKYEWGPLFVCSYQTTDGGPAEMAHPAVMVALVGTVEIP